MRVPADDQRRRLNKIVNPLSEASPYLRPRCCRGCSRRRPETAVAATDDLALFEAGSVFFANDPLLAAPRPPVTQRPSAEELAALDRALGRQPRHLAAVLTGQWVPGWTGPGIPAGWQQAIAFVEAAGCRDRTASWTAARPSTRRGIRAAAPSSRCRRARRSGTPVSCTRRSVRRSACRRAPPLRRSILTR